MRTDLDHLPAAKQRELQLVTKILFEEFQETIARTRDPKKKVSRILKLVLYGSYARGDWVDDPVGGYHSDYDILIVVNDERLTDLVDHWAAADDRLVREVTIAKTISAPVNFIVHTLKDVNKQLEQGRPFFVDIAEQGVILYEAEGFPFASPRKLPPAEARAEAQKHFDYWFPKIGSAIRGAARYVEDGEKNDAVFTLHQAAERAYHCAMLVLTLYSPKSHKLNFLRSHAEDLAPELIEAWPRSDRFSRRCFELLRQAYVNARYSPYYKISAEELEWLAERVRVLQALVKAVCERKLAPRD